MKKLVAVLLAAAVPGCGDSASDVVTWLHVADTIAQQIELVADTTPDHFRIGAFALEYSGTDDYDWWCSAPQANVGLASPNSGSVRLEIRDAAGTVVHDNTFHPVLYGDVSGVTAPGGAPGLWRIRIESQQAVMIGDGIRIDADVAAVEDRVAIGAGNDYDDTLRWQVGWPAGTANASVIQGMWGGNARVRFWDGAGVLVLDVTFDESTGAATFASAPGAAGAWTVEIDLHNAYFYGALVAWR